MVESAFIHHLIRWGYFWNHPNDANLLITGPYYSFLYANMCFVTCIIIIEHAQQVLFHSDQYFGTLKKTCPYMHGQ